MQSVSSRIWTRVAVSNSYDDNTTPRAPRERVDNKSLEIVGLFLLFLNQTRPSAVLRNIWTHEANIWHDARKI